MLAIAIASPVGSKPVASTNSFFSPKLSIVAFLISNLPPLIPIAVAPDIVAPLIIVLPVKDKNIAVYFAVILAVSVIVILTPVDSKPLPETAYEISV